MTVVSVLKQIDLFRGLSTDQLKEIEEITTEEVFVNGDTICKQGDYADKMYIISEGQVEVIVQGGEGRYESVIFLGVGQVVGEMTLVDEGRRSATVVAAEDKTTVYSIPNPDFTQLCQSNTEIGYLIMRNIAQDMSFKLRHSDYVSTKED